MATEIPQSTIEAVAWLRPHALSPTEYDLREAERAIQTALDEGGLVLASEHRAKLAIGTDSLRYNYEHHQRLREAAQAVLDTPWPRKQAAMERLRRELE